MTKSRGIRTTRTQWTDDQVEYLRRHYADSLTKEVAAALSLPVPVVLRKAAALGIYKSLTVITETARCRSASPGHGGIARRFQPGMTPWNKGMSYPGVSPRTQFSAGHKPMNWVAVGSHRINSDGYLDRKTRDAGVSRWCWEPVHRLVWMAANGPLPPGHLVVFKPGRRTAELEAITLDAVELISRAENMRRNSVHQLPPELARLVQLRGVLIKTINRKAKEAA